MDQTLVLTETLDPPGILARRVMGVSAHGDGRLAEKFVPYTEIGAAHTDAGWLLDPMVRVAGRLVDDLRIESANSVPLPEWLTGDPDAETITGTVGAVARALAWLTSFGGDDARVEVQIVAPAAQDGVSAWKGKGSKQGKRADEWWGPVGYRNPTRGPLPTGD